MIILVDFLVYIYVEDFFFWNIYVYENIFKFMWDISDIVFVVNLFVIDDFYLIIIFWYDGVDGLR